MSYEKCMVGAWIGRDWIWELESEPNRSPSVFMSYDAVVGNNPKEHLFENAERSVLSGLLSYTSRPSLSLSSRHSPARLPR